MVPISAFLVKNNALEVFRWTSIAFLIINHFRSNYISYYNKKDDRAFKNGSL